MSSSLKVYTSEYPIIEKYSAIIQTFARAYPCGPVLWLFFLRQMRREVTRPRADLRGSEL